jgi:hypothetical protein
VGLVLRAGRSIIADAAAAARQVLVISSSGLLLARPLARPLERRPSIARERVRAKSTRPHDPIRAFMGVSK